MSVQEYRKRPIVVEAIQWTGDNEAEIQAWAGADTFHALDPEDRVNSDDPECTAALRVAANGNTELGLLTGEWVLRDEAGFYPVKDEIFRKTYEETA